MPSKFINPNRIAELKQLHSECQLALIGVTMNDEKPEDFAAKFMKSFYIERYEKAFKRIIKIHEQAAEDYRDWQDGEFGEDYREEKYSGRGEVPELETA